MDRLCDIWRSYRRLPFWVQIWMAFVLAPANLSAMILWNQPFGLVIAGLAPAGLVLNLPIVFWQRGFSKAVAVPHVLCWSPVVFLGSMVLIEQAATGDMSPALAGLVGINLVSLVFDIPDTLRWLKGARALE